MTFTPTTEQDNAVRLFLEGDDLAIEAGAGTGKTATLKLIAQAAQRIGRRGQYLAFNKDIVRDSAASFPPNVGCSTAHSLAYRSVVTGAMKRRMSMPRMKSTEIARILSVGNYSVDYGSERKPLSRSYLASLAMRAVASFCQSADPEPAEHHVPYIEGIDLPDQATGKRTYRNNDLVRSYLMPSICKAWDDLTSPTGALRFEHDHYLKIWQLSRPRIDVDFILFDEAQDANPVMRDVVEQQRRFGTQLVFVGDSQQQIYAFTGAVNALSQIRESGGNVTFLTQSFRFGPDIAKVANGLLGRLSAELRMVGFDQVSSIVGAIDQPDVILTRTNATVVRLAMEHIAEGGKPYIVGGAKDVVSFCKAALDLMDGHWTSHPELACFSDWDDVLEYVDQDERGGDLRLMVNLIDAFGAQPIIDAMSATVSEADADLILSTAHKSKGREWDTVRLADDFQPQKEGQGETADELRLLYVAVTRARRELDVTMVPHATKGPEIEGEES